MHNYHQPKTSPSASTSIFNNYSSLRGTKQSSLDTAFTIRDCFAKQPGLAKTFLKKQLMSKQPLLLITMLHIKRTCKFSSSSDSSTKFNQGTFPKTGRNRFRAAFWLLFSAKK
jgi:hypothetical protein